MSYSSHRLRYFYASFIVSDDHPRLQKAFAAVPRETFVGPGPWSVMGSALSYVVTPDDDPVFIYQDVLVAIDASRGLNIGMPSAHAVWLQAFDLKEGEVLLQVGVGTGYYSAIIAELVGRDGKVYAYEIDSDLAARATKNLSGWPHVDVRATSGISDHLPKADAVYVCAGITQPSWAWIDALRPGGRLLFPLQPEHGLGGMLMISKPDRGVRWPARFVSRARFIPCDGQQDFEASGRLAAAFAQNWWHVKTFRIDEVPDDTCWYSADGWWLSTATPDIDT